MIQFLSKPFNHVAVLLMSSMLGTQSARACAVCFGAPGDQATEAASAAIIFMLFILLGVLGSFAGFFVYLSRRSGRVAEWEEIMDLEE